MIRFFSTLEWVEKDYPIVKANKHLPAWIKCMPGHGPYDPDDKFQETYVKATTSTIKNCFGMRNLFDRGFIIPMWTDTWIEKDPKSEQIWFHQPMMFPDEGKKPVKTETVMFANYMMVDWLPQAAKDTNRAMVKFDNVWYAESSTHNLLQVPLFYHYNEDFSCTMGVIPITDYGLSQINLNLILKKDKVHVKAGTPLVMLIPVPKEIHVPFKVGKMFKKKSLEDFDKYMFEKNRQTHPNQYLKWLKYFKLKK
jgi:hypothetical protein